jgi:hypothetical protein
VPHFDLRKGLQKGWELRMSRALKKVTVYFTAEEYAPLQALAEDEEVTLSAVVRAKLGLSYKRRGAPAGNRNRRVLQAGAKGDRERSHLVVSDEGEKEENGKNNCRRTGKIIDVDQARSNGCRP